jgi:hypothetical protein
MTARAVEMQHDLDLLKRMYDSTSVDFIGGSSVSGDLAGELVKMTKAASVATRFDMMKNGYEHVGLNNVVERLELASERPGDGILNGYVTPDDFIDDDKIGLNKYVIPRTKEFEYTMDWKGGVSGDMADIIGRRFENEESAFKDLYDTLKHEMRHKYRQRKRLRDRATGKVTKVPLHDALCEATIEYVSERLPEKYKWATPFIVYELLPELIEGLTVFGDETKEKGKNAYRVHDEKMENGKSSYDGFCQKSTYSVCKMKEQGILKDTTEDSVYKAWINEGGSTRPLKQYIHNIVNYKPMSIGKRQTPFSMN